MKGIQEDINISMGMCYRLPTFDLGRKGNPIRDYNKYMGSSSSDPFIVGFLGEEKQNKISIGFL